MSNNSDVPELPVMFRGTDGQLCEKLASDLTYNECFRVAEFLEETGRDGSKARALAGAIRRTESTTLGQVFDFYERLAGQGTP